MFCVVESIPTDPSIPNLQCNNTLHFHK